MRSPLLLLTLALLGMQSVQLPLARGQSKKEATPSEPKALKGLDPVLLTQGKEMRGSSKFALTHRKFHYLFASEANRALFQKDPDRYGIQMAGRCGMMPPMLGNSDLFTVHKNQIYIFASPGCKTRFNASPDRYIADYATRKKVAILIFEGVQIIDYTGPYEVLGQAGCLVSTVAERSDPITTSMGMTVTPAYSFADCPKFDILVLPGGGVNTHLDNSRVMAWVKEKVGESQYTLSVCNGAFFLAKAGLLDGLSATTFHGLIEELKALAPKCKVVIDKRFVDNGKIITSAGLSSGIDGALHLIERLHGRAEAQQVALGMEYNWQPNSDYARAAFADRHIRKVVGRGFDIPDGWGWKVLNHTGDKNAWTRKWAITTSASGAELLKIMDAKLASGEWKRIEGEPSTSAETVQSRWKFTDEDGKPWRGELTVQPMPNEKGKLLASLHIERETSASP
jgi:putative intracellular protease/amidase/YHS domain-containing protein